MSARKALASYYKLDPRNDFTYDRAARGNQGIRIGNSVLPQAWEQSNRDSGWWRRGIEGQFAGFAIPIPRDVFKDAVHSPALRGPDICRGAFDALDLDPLDLGPLD